jgi:hypothetical protein
MTYRRRNRIKNKKKTKKKHGKISTLSTKSFSPFFLFYLLSRGYVFFLFDNLLRPVVVPSVVRNTCYPEGVSRSSSLGCLHVFPLERERKREREREREGTSRG